jgi:Ras GTPase-activating-like protein IQGAP2/3
VPVLQEFVLSVLHQLKDSIDEVPFGIRWLCKATRSLVMEKFPSAEVEAINSFIGGFFFLRYINPIIATPHGKEGGPRERT